MARGSTIWTHLGNGKIAVVEGCGMQPDQHIVLAELWYGAFLGDEAVKALIAAGNHPLLLRRRYGHLVDFSR